MTNAPPLIFQWNEAERTMRCLSSRAGNYFVDGERYILEAREQRSSASHRRYMASVNEVWKTLPEDLEKRFPSADHLRKWALVHAGYADEDTTVWETPEDAMKVAAMIRKRDDFAVISVKGNTVRIFTAKSQDMRSMNNKEFQASVEAVERVIAELIGTTVGELRSAESA